MVANVDGQMYKRSENRIPKLHHTSGRRDKNSFFSLRDRREIRALEKKE